MKKIFLFIFLISAAVLPKTFAQVSNPAVLDTAALSNDLQDIQRFERHISLAKRNFESQNKGAVTLSTRMFTKIIRTKVQQSAARVDLVPVDLKKAFAARAEKYAEAEKTIDKNAFLDATKEAADAKFKLLDEVLAAMKADLEMWKMKLGIKELKTPEQSAKASRQPKN